MRKFIISHDSNAVIIKTLFAVIMCCMIFFAAVNNVYTEAYITVAAVGVGIAVVLLIIYAFVDGKEYLRIIAYVLFAIFYVVCMVIFIFVSEYDEPYNQRGRFRPPLSEKANKIVRDIREDLSADKVFDFDEPLIKEDDDDFSAHIITVFEKYDINGHFRNEYKSGNEQITVYQEYCYFDRIVSDKNKEAYANWLKGKYLSGHELHSDYNFSEDDYIKGEKDGLEYQYMYKRLSGNISYFIVYMQDEDTFFTMSIRIQSQSRLNFDKEKVMENILTAVNENGIMKTVEQ